MREKDLTLVMSVSEQDYDPGFTSSSSYPLCTQSSLRTDYDHDAFR
jgi:hypothetical protein